MTHSLRITLFGITILMLGILTTLTLTPTPAEAATCNLYSAATAVPQGYGASYNVFNTSQLLVSLSCNDTTVTVTAGDNDPYTYVYNQGYIYKNNAWTPYSLSCSGGESLISGAWCPKQAKATINNAPQDATNYIIAYTCQWRTDAWKCGCKDTTCSTGLWQLQGYPPAQTTPPPTLNGTIFNDDFESGNLSNSANGFQWFGGGGNPGNKPVVSSDISHSGNHSLKFIFRGVPEDKDSSSEQRFDLGNAYPEVWIQYYIYFPDGSEGISPRYKHRIPGNNKFIRLWGGESRRDKETATISGGASLFQTNSVYSKIGAEYSVTYNGSRVHSMGRQGIPTAALVTPSTIGTWIKVKYHVKVATEANNDGVIQIWINDDLMTDEQNLAIYPGNGYPNAYTAGYLLGWANSGFDEETNIYIDNVTFSTESLR